MFSRSVYIILLLLPLSVWAQNNLIPDPGVCSSSKAPFQYTVTSAWNSNTGGKVDNRHTPMIGDIDGDGKVEVFASNGTAGGGKKIYVFDGTDGSTITTIDCDGIGTSWTNGLLICNIGRNTDGRGQVFVAGDNKINYLYEVTSAPGVRPMTFGLVWSKETPVAVGTNMPVVSDLDGDGLVEFVVGRYIIDANTGETLTTLALGGYDKMFSRFPLVVDLDGDGHPEVVVGPYAYKFDRTVTPDKAIPWRTCPGITTDGVNMAADVNQDGIVDLVYSDASKPTCKVTVWTPLTNMTIGSFSFATANAVSYPFVGDIDGEDNGGGKKYPEIVINTQAKLTAFKYDGGTTFSEKWTLAHSDGSGATSLTLFDFDYDGVVELVYRDETHLHIFDGRGNSPVVKYSIKCGSMTIVETPIIADVTGDGSADIIVTGNTAGTNSSPGEVMVFQGKDSPWAAAPSVWNQQLYSTLLVNMDLTIPRTVQSPVLTFTDCNSKRIQLYNGGPMQAPMISDATFCPIEPAFDVYVVDGSITTTATQVIFTITVGNQGSRAVPGAIPIQFYKNTMVAANSIGSTTLGADLAVGATRVITKTITITGTMPTQFYVRLLDDAVSFPAAGTYRDCDLTNNSKSFGTLELSKTVDSNIGCTDGVKVFTVKITNNELVARNNILLTDSLGADWNYISAAPSLGTSIGAYDPLTRKLTWTIPSLAAGGSAELLLIAKAIVSGTLRNTAWIESVDGTVLGRENKGAYVVVAATLAPAAPVISPSGSVDFCAGGGTILSASGSGTFQWYRNGLLLTGVTAATYEATQEGVYTVTVLNGTCTSDFSAGVTLTEINCGTTTPTGCAVDGTILFKESFDQYDDGLLSGSINFSTVPLPAGRTSYLFYDGVNTLVKDHPSGQPGGEYITAYPGNENVSIVYPLWGEYALVKKAVNFYNSWGLTVDDHTFSNDDTKGRMMVVDATAKPGVFYSHAIDGLCERSTLYFSTWVLNFNKENGGTTPDRPNMIFVLSDLSNGQEITRYYTGNVPDWGPSDNNTTKPTWKQYGFSLNVPDGVTGLRMDIINNGASSQGNDFALDDIEIRLCVPLVTIEPAKDTIVCKGATIELKGSYVDNGAFKLDPATDLVYRWERKLVGATTWTSWRSGSVSGNVLDISETLSDIQPSDEGYYHFLVANSATIDRQNCRAASDSFYVKIREILVLPDIRVQVCPDHTAGTKLNLSSYLYVGDYDNKWNVEWWNVTPPPYSPLVSTSDPKGEVALDFDRGTHVYKYKMSNECYADSARFYISTLLNQTIQMPPKQVVVCKEVAANLHINQIMGVEANGAIGLALLDPANAHLTRPQVPSPFVGSLIFNGKTAWNDPSIPHFDYQDDPANKAIKVTFVYNSDPGSCLLGQTYTLEVIVLENIVN